MNNGFDFGGFEHDVGVTDDRIERLIKTVVSVPSIKSEHELAQELVAGGHPEDLVFFAVVAARIWCAQVVSDICANAPENGV